MTPWRSLDWLLIRLLPGSCRVERVVRAPSPPLGARAGVACVGKPRHPTNAGGVPRTARAGTVEGVPGKTPPAPSWSLASSSWSLASPDLEAYPPTAHELELAEAWADNELDTYACRALWLETDTLPRALAVLHRVRSLRAIRAALDVGDRAFGVPPTQRET